MNNLASQELYYIISEVTAEDVAKMERKKSIALERKKSQAAKLKEQEEKKLAKLAEAAK